VESTIDMREIQKNIAEQIDLIKNPIQLTLPPPFNNN
jgi:hypothetical protein